MTAVFDVRSPADQQVIGQVPLDTAASVTAKVAAAARGLSAWAAQGTAARSASLIDVASVTSDHLGELRTLLSQEQGKTGKEADIELDRYLGALYQYAGLGVSRGGQSFDLGPGVSGVVERRPAGVVAAIVPFNFPASLFATKLGPALAAGCTVVVKPALTTSLITSRLVELANHVLPAGVLDVAVGDGEVGDALVRHPDVTRVAFTGSTEVGRTIAATAAPAMKRLTLELGGCDPFVLLDDGDVAGAVRALMGTRYFNAGQVCVAPKRLIVHQEVAEETVERLVERIARIRLGPPLSEGSTMGPLHRADVRDRLDGQIADAADRGANIVGGGRPDDPELPDGWFVRPSLVLDPPHAARVRTEETFGPALTVVRVADDEEAVAVANETSFSLGCSVWSANLARAREVANRIPAGYTWINALARVYDELPFGGVGQSGVGREHGAEALDSYVEARSFIIGGT